VGKNRDVNGPTFSGPARPVANFFGPARPVWFSKFFGPARFGPFQPVSKFLNKNYYKTITKVLNVFQYNIYYFKIKKIFYIKLKLFLYKLNFKLKIFKKWKNY